MRPDHPWQESRAVSALLPVMAVTTALLAAALVVRVSGRDPVVAFHALVAGAAGDPNAVAESLVKAAPLLLCSLGVAVAFRAGVWNIGAEGQFLVGALTAAWLGGLPEGAPVAAALVAGALAGALWAWFAALLKTHRGVQEIISTIMLNWIAYYLVSWAVHGPLMDAAGGLPETRFIGAQAELSRLTLGPFAGTRLHAGVLIALLMAPVTWWLLERTVLGFRVRAVGANQRAAETAGIPVGATIGWTMVLSGALAGLGGAVELCGLLHKLQEYWPGYGYTAIAVSLVGGLNPLGVLPAALFFGSLEAGARSMERIANTPAVTVSVIQGVVVFLVAGWPVLQRRWRRLSPAAPAPPEEGSCRPTG